MVGVAEEREGEVVLLGELLVLFLTVETDAEDLRVLRLVLGLEVPEPGTFPRSTGCVGLRIEPEHHLLAAQIAQTNGVAVVIDRLEIRSSLTRLEHLSSSSGHGSDDAADGHGEHSTLMFHESPNIQAVAAPPPTERRRLAGAPLLRTKPARTREKRPRCDHRGRLGVLWLRPQHSKNYFIHSNTL
jgi:hypothetical protein